jgi:hypothetical protein
MTPKQATRRGGGGKSSPPKLFTVESANRALVLVRQIVEDVVLRYQELMALRSEREELAGEVGAERKLATLQARHQSLIETLDKLSEELSDIGVDLKDWSGLVDFPARHDGRPVLLCWRLGEPAVAYWHELDGGFKGRQAIEPGFEVEAS